MMVKIKSRVPQLDGSLVDKVKMENDEPFAYFVPAWISVDERLPETEGSTLICTKGGAVCTARFYPGRGWNGYAGKNAAYWMPLPEPPEVNREES